MSRIEAHRQDFPSADDREAYLRANSRLPGPRANLELLNAAAEEIDRQTAVNWAARGVADEPTDAFVVMVGLVALGRFAAGGDAEALVTLRRRASDAEWRIREAVVIGLQRLGDEDPGRLEQIARDWAAGSPLEARAAVAAVAEPRLLRDGRLVACALQVHDAATALIANAETIALVKGSDLFVLRQALGYGWSVVVAADPDSGWPRFERWASSSNPNISWIMAENLKKDRLRRLQGAATR